MKSFSEAFPTLNLHTDLAGQLQDAQIVRISMSRDEQALHVYLESSHLISRDSLHAVEKEIASQILKPMLMGKAGKVFIHERFHLQEPMPVRSFLDVYEDSILTELKGRDHVLYRLYFNAEKEFPAQGTLRLILQDHLVSHAKEEELAAVLDGIFHERCGLDTQIEFDYRAVESSGREEKQKQIRQEVVRITEAREAAKEKKEQPVIAEKKPVRKKPAQNTDPSLIFGRDFDEPSIPISDVLHNGDAVITGCVIRLEVRELRNENKMLLFDVTDFSDTISVKMFPKKDQLDALLPQIREGAFLTLKATASLDQYEHELSLGYVYGIKKADDFRGIRKDLAEVKRVELHCHTKMSDMDGVSDVTDIIRRAAAWGQDAIAITDHGVVQAFTDAFHALPDIRKEHPDFKLIYGVEGYLVDDVTDLVINPIPYGLRDTFVVFDLETTGLSAADDTIIEIGAVKVCDGQILDTFSTFVNPNRKIPERIVELTGINDEMVEDAPFLSEVLPDFLDFIGDAVLVAHNADFDMSFVMRKGEELGITRQYTYADTVGMARVLLKNIAKFTLDNVAKNLKIKLKNHHRAVDDASCTAEIFLRFVSMLEEQGIHDLAGLNALGASSVERVKKSRPYHVILLAKNEIGRIHLYKLISLSHLKYFQKQPRIPKSVLMQYREGLIIGSACEQGEVFRAVLNRRSEQEIRRLVEFYDYLEVQPIGNNAFLKRESEYENIRTDEDLQELNKKIVDLGERYNKPVVATCDVHFLDPEDEVYRRILQCGKGFPDADNQPPIYLRTTEEMLAEFDYLPREKAEEIVVKNTRMISDMIDLIEPVRPDKCPPVIEDSDVTLKEICYRKAHEVYGETLPEPVATRLERELQSIISNGFAVMYIIAQKLVWKSVEDGYLVGSRGSVGSSFVATMAGITEVNPLPPHYYCPKCHYSDFTSEAVRAYAGKAGCDMPDAVCPVCGEPLKKDGFDIPFETFLGFKGDKEPDIDLNFSGEYQATAHKYTEVLFGKGQTFKAGTIGTLKDKKAYGFVKKYYEEKNAIKRSCEINRLSAGCSGVRQTTGQHPGGIIVLPHGEDIDTFTPIQHPANDMTSDIITTHFDYHSIDHNLLKLDILGHDDPTMIRRLADLTGIDPRQVPLDDPKVMSLFQDTEALGISPKDIGGCPLGSLGIPEFGTDFAMQMLIDTAPTSFSDLVRIAGLAHGTDVWLGNAKKLILEGTATISTAICTRDDIMTYLIGKGVDPLVSFKIMEDVRKGKVAKGKCDSWNEWKKIMLDAGVPDWYIWSCEKIAYMFPKAHAAAYVMMAWRIAYFKIYYPLAYYAAYLSIRATAFDYEKMCQGKQKLATLIADYRSREDSLDKKEQDELKDMRVVEEMYARGFTFRPIDLFLADAHACRIIDGQIMPHIGSIEGLGDKAADAVAEACKAGPFLSKDDFRERTKVNKTAVSKLDELGLLGDLPDSNQLSLFDGGFFLPA